MKPDENLEVPVLIYQMGKVGCTTVKRTLDEAQVPAECPVHFLAWERIIRLERHFQGQPDGEIPEHLKHGRRLRTLIDETWGQVRWNIITLVRDPVARIVASQFDESAQQILGSNPAPSEADLVAVIERALTALTTERWNTSYTLDWFDRELKGVFEFDVFDHPFNQQRGYEIYEAEVARIAVLRLEDLNSVYRDVFQELLQTDVGSLVQANRTAEKVYGRAYTAFLRRLWFPGEFLDEIYSSRFARHFYSAEQLAGFRLRWSGG